MYITNTTEYVGDASQNGMAYGYLGIHVASGRTVRQRSAGGLRTVRGTLHGPSNIGSNRLSYCAN